MSSGLRELSPVALQFLPSLLFLQVFGSPGALNLVLGRLKVDPFRSLVF